MIAVTLYSTAGCHLCEDALDLVAQLDGLALDVVDIADHDDLVTRYGVRIPVVRIGDDELGWPFSRLQLAAFVDARRRR